MPEYLHPGVYIEETSFRGKAIEGVSTSTAGIVGRSPKGPEGKPTLVTSFAQFVREFGPAYSLTSGVTPKLGDYLGHSVRAFFENGGKRAYIVRVLHNDALKAFVSTPGGALWTLQTNKVLRVGMTVVPLVSTRGLKVGDHIRIFTRPDPTAAFVDRGEVAISAVDVTRNEVTVPALTAVLIGGAGAPATVTSSDADTYFLPAPGPGFAAVPPTGPGPTFRAKFRGNGGNSIAVQVRSADRPAVAIRTAAGAATTVLDVASTAAFYEGAIVEITRTGANRDYQQIQSVNAAARTITLTGATGGAVTVNDFVKTLEIDILVYEGGALRETFTGLSWNANPALASFSRYFAERINDPANGSDLVEVMTTTSVGPPAPLPAPQPPLMGLTPTGQFTTINGQPVLLTNGSDGGDPTNVDLIGTDGGPGNRTGIEALRERDDIALVAVPGVTDEAVQAALLVHCELLKYRFAVLDGKPATSDISKIESHRNNYDSKYGGYYTPWLKTLDLATGREMLNPPSGYVLGICARVDNERGVHKAPANEVVRGITDVELRFGDGEQDVLNPKGINLIREFEGRGIRVWGARTTTSDTEWKYVNVRRLFIFLEHSIDRGTQWVVFEPNTESLWQRVVETIESFLFGVWKSGALMGTKPEEAYFVRCDRTTMTQDDIDNGRLVCLIGVAPAYPAEFVIFRIGQFTASTNRA
jgi:phage tail sheath protein FI